jgi:hypothetical protein
MKKTLFSFLTILIFLVSSCEVENGFTISDPVAIDCPAGQICTGGGGVPLPPDPPTPPTPTVSDYDRGYATGISDAKDLFMGFTRAVECNKPPCPFPSCPDDIDKEFNIPADRKCRAWLYAGAQSHFNSFIIGYRQNLQNIINTSTPGSTPHDFHLGLLNGFNYQLLYYNVKYGVLIP